MPADLRNTELNEQVRALVAGASDNANEDLIEELVATVLKLHRDGSSRADLKLITTALKEMRYSNLVFSRHEEPKVTIYGSARLTSEDPNYTLTEEVAALMAAEGWGVITGAGPGIMEAGSKGAGIENSYGVNIRLPFEDKANGFIDEARTVNFKYFFTRKLGFVKESHAFVILPGGFGTLDETFELLTLIQTGKSDMHPVVLLEADDTGYWEPMIAFMRDVQLASGLISPADLGLFFHTCSAVEARDHVTGFYANYHSQRYASGRLILRLRKAPDDAQLEEINRDFSDIVASGVIERIEPTDAEMADNDFPELDRIAFNFDRRQFGRLKDLIDRLNSLVSGSTRQRLPGVMTEEHAERPW